jgi:hypothetical protein
MNSLQNHKHKNFNEKKNAINNPVGNAKNKKDSTLTRKDTIHVSSRFTSFNALPSYISFLLIICSNKKGHIPQGLVVELQIQQQ